jgi:biopolymer transport protein ExbD
MNDLGPKRHRREPMDLQLTSLIDVFSLLVIFLVLTSVFGASDLSFPSEIKLPKSKSEESVESGPTVVITSQEVKLSSPLLSVPLEEFELQKASTSPSIAEMKSKISEELAKSNATTNSPRQLSVIADHKTSYQTVFNVIALLRTAGYESLLLIADTEVQK